MLNECSYVLYIVGRFILIINDNKSNLGNGSLLEKKISGFFLTDTLRCEYIVISLQLSFGSYLPTRKQLNAFLV